MGGGQFFDWQHNWRIHYVQAGVAAGKPPLLLCPGFGVGTNHFERNLGPLAEAHQVFALDYLGQGRSWPEGDIEPHHGLVLSVETWMEQIVSFIEDVVKEPCYLAGNSLGGFLATAVAATRPDLVKGVVLFNATPFWSFAPNRRGLSEWVKRTIVPYDGTLPAPSGAYKLGAAWFDGLRNPVTVKSMLSGAWLWLWLHALRRALLFLCLIWPCVFLFEGENVYACVPWTTQHTEPYPSNPSTSTTSPIAVYADDCAWDERLVAEILRPTEHPHGHAAFTSILFAPKAPMTFEEYLERVQAPILMLYGKGALPCRVLAGDGGGVGRGWRIDGRIEPRT